MVHVNCKKLLLAACLAAFPFLAHAQFTLTGSERGNIHWQAVTTPDFKVVYPAGLDSLAGVYAYRLQQARPLVGLSAGYFPNQVYRNPMPVLLHPYTGVSNGMVAWAPRRMELYTLPTQLTALPWEKVLSIHESRHVAQMQIGRSGFWRYASYPFGEGANMVVNILYVNGAILEGDAVVAETALTNSGRGRTASFLSYIRMALDQGDWRNWYRWRFGSIKYYTPDHYRVGYMTVAGMRYTYDAPLFMSDYLHRLTRPWGFFALSEAMKHTSGKRFNATWREIAETFHTIWAADDSLRAPFQNLVPATEEVNPLFTSYAGAVEVGDGRVWAIRSGMDRAAELVELTPDGNVRALRPFGGNSKLAASPDGQWVYWSETAPSARWEMEETVRIIRMRVGEKTFPEALTRRGRLCHPAVSDDGETLVAIDYPTNGGSALVFLDAATGIEIGRTEAPAGLQLMEAGFLGKDVVVAAIDERGSGLYRVSGQEFTHLLDPRPVSIKDLRTYDGAVYFTCDRTGTDEIYVFRPEDSSLTRLTNTHYGVGDPFLVGGTLAFAALTPKGYALMRPEERFQESADFSVVASYPVADKLAAQEKALIASAEPASAPEIKPSSYDAFPQLFHFHTWLPFYYNYDGFSATETDYHHQRITLGATGFFQNLTGTSSGFVGLSVHEDPFVENRLQAGFHARYKYTGWFPVVSLAFDAGDRSPAVLRYVYDEKTRHDTALEASPNPERPGLYLGGSAGVSVPLNFSSFGWKRSITPALTVGACTDINEFNDRDNLYHFNRLWVEASLRGAAQLGVAKSQVIPRWGIGAVAKARLATDARVLFGQGWLYLPGITRTQGLKATGALQLRKLVVKDAMYPFDYNSENLAPRGFDKTVVPALLSRMGYATARASLDYVMPLFAIDQHITSFLYFRNIEVIPFVDVTAFLSEMSLGIRRRNQILYSVGADVNACILVGAIPPFRLGLRLAWNGGPCYDWFKENAGLKRPFTVQAIMNINL